MREELVEVLGRCEGEEQAELVLTDIDISVFLLNRVPRFLGKIDAGVFELGRQHLHLHE